ncbi:MAG: hypothetical protein ACFE0Q_17835 [Anaerolineae bacterium]
MEHRRNRGSIGRTFMGTFFIIIGIIFCTATSIGAIDFYCRADINHWMPIYPDAELVETQENGFFRPRASGITQQIYHTSDDTLTVRNWYRDYRIEITQGLFSENPNAPASGIATTNFQISEDSERGGSRITYYSECAYR